jgi:hypothetical protein
MVVSVADCSAAARTSLCLTVNVNRATEIRREWCCTPLVSQFEFLFTVFFFFCSNRTSICCREGDTEVLYLFNKRQETRHNYFTIELPLVLIV